MATGIYYNKKQDRYIAYITKGTRRIHVGTFEDEESAIAARQEKCDDLGIPFTRQRGRPSGRGNVTNNKARIEALELEVFEMNKKLVYLYKKYGALQSKFYELNKS